MDEQRKNVIAYKSKLENENNIGDFVQNFWLKTTEFGDITIKSVGDFLIKFGYG